MKTKMIHCLRDERPSTALCGRPADKVITVGEADFRKATGPICSKCAGYVTGNERLEEHRKLTENLRKYPLVYMEHVRHSRNDLERAVDRLCEKFFEAAHRHLEPTLGVSRDSLYDALAPVDREIVQAADQMKEAIGSFCELVAWNYPDRRPG